MTFVMASLKTLAATYIELMRRKKALNLAL